MKNAQIVLYMVLGLVIFLVFLGLINLVVNLVPGNKVISPTDVTQYITNCLNLGLTCSLYTAGLNSQTEPTSYTENAFKNCLGDLSQKFKGNKFTFTNTKPSLQLNDETSSATLSQLGEMQNGNTKKTLESFAAQNNVAFRKINELKEKLLLNKGKSKLIQNLDPRYFLNIYQIDDSKEAVIITDKQSKINENEYKVLFVN
ncbi:hypothetical protein HY485_04955 [Candidatus Woesearchaeota archaeon]|nr:hypothetical protein [Candidatus Woesearchaeota archaeon]